MPNFIKNIPEEFAWRGYLTPKVFLLKVNDVLLYLVVGIIWGVWHIPYYLFFLDTAAFQSVTTLGTGIFIPLSIVVMISWSIVLVELVLITNSVWPVVLAHIIEDAFVNPLFIEGHVQILHGKELLVSPIYGIISIIFYVAIGIALRQLRKRRNSSLQE